MAFLDYIKEATSWIFETILSGTLDICTNMVQWCASASVSFWDASLVNTLLQAGAGVSILVWGVSLIIVIQDVLEAISEEKRVYLGSVIGDSLKAIVFSQASPFLGILVIKFLFQIMALLNWSDSLVANWQSMIAVATGFSGILGIIITVIASVYFFYAYFVRCEAFGLQHMDTMRLTMGGATDREVENYIRQVTEALTPKAYEDLFCQIRAEISNGRFHIYDIEHSSTPLVGEGSVPQGLTPEAAAKQWLRGPNGAPYRMRGVHAYENLLEIPEDKRLVELDHDTFQWCPRKEVALSGIDQALSQYVKTWRQQEQPKGASTPKSNAERKSAVDIAKEQIQNLCNSFKKDPQQYVEYLKFSARFYKYSGRNMMLIYHQKPSANFVASRTAFKDMGYDLKPGQWKYPAWIIRPETKTLFVTADGVVADIKCATAQEKADIRDGKIPTEKFTYFRAAKVYEIGQTTCPAKDYPQILGHGIDDQQHKELYTRLQAVAGMSGFIVSEEPLPSSEFGYCSHDKRIVISDSLGDTQKLATLNHEFAHGLLHLTSDLSPAVEEFEAESVALIMQQRLGLPVEDLTVQYVKNALREAGNLPEFSMEESLGRIVKQANYVCDRLELQRIQQQEVMPVQNQTPVIQAQPNFGLTL